MSDVLILTPFFSPNIGGVETHLDDLVDTLKTQSFKSYVLTYQPLMLKITAPQKETKGNVEIHRIEWIRSLFYKVEPYPILDFLYLTPRLLWATFFFLISHRNIKVIHAQGINASFIAVLLKPVFNIKVVISTHAVYEFQGESLFAKVTRWTFNKADRILSLLNHSKTELVKLGVAADKIVPYTYWINQEIFSPKDKIESKQKLMWNINQSHVLFVGRIFEKKGINELLEAAQLLRDNPEIKIHIAGTGPLEEKVREAAQKNTNINFIGKIVNTDLPKYYQAADVFIIPSTHEEGAGRVIMEALSCGTPVIGSNRGGIPEILDSSVGEFVDVSAKNIVNAIQSIQKRITNGELTSIQCRDYSEKRFSNKNAELIINSYA
ncbi:MAG: glycosyltransferase family 4 protein [bacterium]|nr:glycosyltransferase family 4 protein [bacterium]